jgi:hypothetical protein
MTEHKPRKTRSPNYPGIDLSVAVAKATELLNKIGRHPVGTSVAMQTMRYSPTSSSGMIALAALRAFGLLEDVRGHKDPMVKLSERGLDLAGDYESESPEWYEQLKKAAVAPNIHNELWLRYGPTLPVDAELRRYLVREKGFNDKTVGAFIAEYKATIAFAKMDGSDIMPDVDQDTNGELGEEMDDDLPATRRKGSGVPQQPPAFPGTSIQRQLPPGNSLPAMEHGMRDFPLYTSSHRGALYVPESMSRRDYDLLKSQIENSLKVIEATAVQSTE